MTRSSPLPRKTTTPSSSALRTRTTPSSDRPPSSSPATRRGRRAVRKSPLSPSPPLRRSILVVVSSLLLLGRRGALSQDAVGDFDHNDRDPALRWSSDLSTLLQLDAFAKGNAVALMPGDDSVIYATTLRGALVSRELNTTNYRGEPVGPWRKYQTPDRDDGWSTKCRTGIAFSLSTIERPYLVYAVEDDPPVFNAESATPSSRIVAFNHPFREGDGPRWISEPLEGIVSGTPVVSSDGRFVFVNHNDNSNEGVFSVLQSGNQAARLLRSLTSDGLVVPARPFAPLAVARSPLRGKYADGDANRNDLLVWARLHVEDDLNSWENGYVHGFQFSTTFNGNDASGERILNLQEVPWSSFGRPAFSSSGLELYFGTSKSEARGWWNPDDKFNNRPTWKAEDLLRDESRALKSLPGDGGVVLSPDEDLLFTSTTVNAFYCLSAVTGTPLWFDPAMSSIVRTEAIVSPDGRRVYSLASDGVLVSKRASDGRNQWRFQADATATETEMALSADGTTLYYAGNRGTNGRFVYALGVGEYVTASPTATPTIAPTDAPTTLSPTSIPTVVPTAMPTPSEPTSKSPTAAPTAEPTMTPTPEPTAEPIEEPTPEPTAEPTAEPTVAPTPEVTDGLNVTAASSAKRRGGWAGARQCAGIAVRAAGGAVAAWAATAALGG